ncbi:GIY-YIG catalytic domain-containing endonuclease [Faustovirus]|nr:GIY-YIG catalytic domain-containing endonuclease [Faustovirus]QJX73475.1 GIY-YIG catalytic domain-containing endonuclease [Faustovirus]
MERQGLIYKITSPNGKVYIGQTIQTFETRMGQHKNDATSGADKCPHLDAAIRTHGWDNFTREIVLHCDQSELGDHEKRLIAEYKSNDPEIGYNIHEGGAGAPHPDYVRTKISQGKRKAGNEELPQHISPFYDKKTKDQSGYAVTYEGKQYSITAMKAGFTLEEKLQMAIELVEKLKRGDKIEKFQMRQYREDMDLPYEVRANRTGGIIQYYIMDKNWNKLKIFKSKDSEKNKRLALEYYAEHYK